jgi:N-methylhydantoinase A
LSFKLAVDIGGTNTDAMSIDNKGNISLTKHPTNFKDLTASVIEDINQLNLDLKDAELIIHGTVIILNSLLQGKIGKTGLVTTEGFRDVLEIMRTNRPEELIFDIQQTKPTPLVPRYLRLEIPERINFMGHILRTLDKKKSEASIKTLKKYGAEAIAICLINSYTNDIHEKKPLHARNFF